MTYNAFLSPAEIEELKQAEAASDKLQKRTAEQIEAIYSSGQNILVSASAGSGKTFVMVQRILDQLMRGVGISQLFISTFTVKAAGELRERLEKELKKVIADTSSSDLRRHLSQQLIDLPQADIGTMDAFTQKLLTDYGYLLGIAPQFRILTDPSEQDWLKDEVFADLFQDYMAGKDRSVFTHLVRNFSGKGKDSKGFRQAVSSIYQFTQSTPNPCLWLKEVFLKSASQELTMADIPDERVETFLASLLETADGLEDLTHLEGYKQTTATGKPSATYQKHRTMINQLRDWVRDFRLLYGKEGLSRLAQDVSQLLPSGSEVTVAGNKYPVFKALKAQLTDIRHLELILTYQPESQAILQLLQAFMLDFQSQYLARKLAENVLEFADVSHLAIRLLTDFPEVRESFQARYHEVMVDEYQDTNHTQEAMLDLLSRGNNRFMVGDIKQSIYRFRQADPQIFNQKFQTYLEDPKEGKLILLKENFRSQTEVLSATNSVFTKLMDQDLGEVTYDSRHELLAGSPSQLLINTANRTQYLLYDSDSSEEEVSSGEVELVAKEIIRLHKEEGVAFKDITLLVASRSRNDKILSIFDQRGIPLVSDGGEQSYLKALEVMVMLDTLRTINNPLHDYALVALLKSPMFHFDEDELTRLAVQGPKETKLNLYQKMQLAQQGTGSQPQLITPALKTKLERFMETLLAWRFYARSHSLYDLIWKIYQDRLYYDHVGAMSKGKQRQANLYALALRANQFEKTGFKGLSRFIRMIDRVLASQNDLADVELAPPKDAVSLMTIHKSKGLQFKYVFILNMDKTFDRRDEQARLILSRTEGIGIKYLADMKSAFEGKTTLPHVRVLMQTLPYQTNLAQLKRAHLSEQMRLLYVAMTRAEKKLYLVGKGSSSKLLSKFGDQVVDGRLPLAVREGLTSFQDWFWALRQAFGDERLDFEWQLVTDDDLTDEAIGQVMPAAPIALDDVSDNRQSEAIGRALDMMESVDRLNQTYAKAIALPTLRTPSQVKVLYEPLLDSEGLDVIDKKPVTPSFSLPDLSAKDQVSAVALGSAVHQLMQLLSLDQPVTEQLVAETVAILPVDDKVKARIDQKKIVAFFATTLGQLILSHADRVEREAPFALLHQDPETGEEFVIRGIIDGFVKLEDRIILFDYKTDKYQSSQTIKLRYQAQMALYAKALKQAYGVATVEAYLVLLGGQDMEVIAYDR